MAFDTVRPTVLITGATAGIGSELVPFFAGTGHNVVLVARDKPVLEGIAAAVRKVFRVDATAIACDLTQPDGAHAIFAELTRREIKIDMLVNNAGFSTYGEFAVSGPETDEQIIQGNIVALTVLTNLLVPRMLARGTGKILNVAPTEDFASTAMHHVYSATKAYVLSFSETLAEELKGTGVTVTSLCPDLGETATSKCAGLESTLPRQEQPISARSVARSGFRALIRGDRVAMPGWGTLAMASQIA